MAKILRFTLPMMAAFLFMALSTSANAAKPTDPTEPEPSTGPDRMIWLGDDDVNGIQVFPFTSINSLWCRVPPDNRIEVSFIRISDNQLFTSVVDPDPVDFYAACMAWLDYLNGDGPRPQSNR